MKTQGYKIPKVLKMTASEYSAYAERVRKKCPRGKNFFCDGTPNPIPQEPYEKIGKCKHFKNGDCTLFDKER